MAEKDRNRIKDKVMQNRDRIAVILSVLYLCFLALSVIIIIRILHIQHSEINPVIAEDFRPKSSKHIEVPVRGAIIAEDGRLLAISTPMYQIYMDCSVQKDEYSADQVNGDAKEKAWRRCADSLSHSLSTFYKDKTPKEYYDLIITSRNKGSRFVKIGGQIDHEQLQNVKRFPLFNKDANVGGMLIFKRETRQYPYGTLARRCIGYVKDNSNSNGNNHIGLEGKYDYVLHGKEGYEWLRVSDNRSRIQNYDSTYVKAEDGMDVRTTLNIDIQDIADRALRAQIADKPEIEGGCVIILDVKTGAVRAMVNLTRDSTDNTLNEVYNMAIGRKGEPGSVFKSATLMTLIEDGYVKTLNQTIPTNHGIMAGFQPDEHIPGYESSHHTNQISIIDGFKMSSNYVFRYLTVTNYGKRPKKYLDKIYMYKLGEAFDFDLDGLKTPTIPNPDSPSWSGTDLGSAAIGYSVSETPLHIVTFYNAIANKGRMMKPYLVEDIEENGIVKEKRGPSVLNASICSKATADTLLRGLKAVTEEGTAQRLKFTKCEVAGKTGTSRIVLDPKYTGGIEGRYEDKYGRKQNQATFVGFFPADEPRYTAVVTIYSGLTSQSFYGGTLPALAMKDIVDNIYSLDETGAEVLTQKGKMPQMKSRNLAAVKRSIAPDVRGMGLKDAVYLIENSDYRCTYQGCGHIVSQTPEGGTALAKGSTISLVLE